MSKDKISDYSQTANSNTDIGGINVDEGCAPSGINNAIRTLMKQLKDWQSGSQDVYITPAGSAAAPAVTTTGDTNTGVYFPAADKVGITTGGTERVIVDSSGNVGIGTSSPLSKLDVVGSGSYDGVVSVRSTGTNTPRVALGVDAVASADGYVGTVNNFPLQFRTNDTERARIDSSGNLLVGTTSNSNSVKILSDGSNTNVCAEFKRSGTGAVANVYLSNGNGIVGQINTSGSSTAYVTSSDYRLKENISSMTGALATVAQLKPCTYTWKVDGSAGQGFIAHELQAVVPDCVTGEKDAVDADGNPVYQGIDTSFLVATLTAAIQEQQAIITSLTERITALEAK